MDFSDVSGCQYDRDGTRHLARRILSSTGKECLEQLCRQLGVAWLLISERSAFPEQQMLRTPAPVGRYLAPPVNGRRRAVYNLKAPSCLAYHNAMETSRPVQSKSSSAVAREQPCSVFVRWM